MNTFLIPVIILVFVVLAMTMLHLPLLLGQRGGEGKSKGKSESESESEKQCICENKFSTENLGKVLTGNTEPVTPTDGDNDEIDLVKGAQKRLVSSPEQITVKTVALCSTLKKTGFNPKWTIHDIQLLSMNENGRKQLYNIDSKLKSHGLVLKHSDIAKCFPGYMKGYICTPIPTLESVSAPVSKSHDLVSEGKVSVPEGTRANSETEAVIDQKQEGIMHCHWPSIENDIHQSVSEFYRTKSDDTDPEKLVMESSYTIQRAMLEIKNIINMFQNKPKSEFGEFLASKKDQDITGLQLDGTKYHIPWYIFGKYNVCFGSL